MNTKTDIKSALVGLGAGVIVALVVAAASSSGRPVGRYQITSNEVASYGSECFVIDTVSGKVWKASVQPNGGSDGDLFQEKNSEK